ncbi:DMT family transporter [Labrys wisconsinensis]|uniref:Drug/metabolite transporter (DMT)-like permease n=1 Tax=Labrys wisconsinensis TaxID=425677 RepID=A0ABU0JJQ1_9HYPH|nr:DMT family transporter [Labrys wisconsinensis]MDQ0474515.1 drug/metabolite transporter (DMT)-like permease [Labrys wisconsinensis]
MAGETSVEEESGKAARSSWLARLAGLGGRAGLAWGLIAVAIWSGSFVLTRLGMRTSLGACDITALRFGFAGVLMLPVIRREGLALARLGWAGLAVLIAGTGAPYVLLIALGLRFAPAGQAAALVPGPMCAMAAILAAALLHERLAARGWWGVAAILAGSVLIAGLGPGGLDPGHAAFLAAALLWAGYVLVLRRSGLTALHATAIVAVGSAVLYLPIYAAVLPVGLGQAPLADIVLQAVYQGGLTTVLGLLAFNRAVALLGPVAGAALPALVPVVTLVLAALLLGEAPGLRDIAAAGLIGAGVALVTSARTARPRKETT